ncbi:MAG: hypothetical protein RLZZ325_444 [Pseudomonadota bacterium]
MAKSFLNRILYFLLSILMLGCAATGSDSNQSGAEKLDPLVPREEITKFSEQSVNEPLRGWSFYRVAPYKKNTAYRLENYQGRTVLSANAKKSSSGLAVKLKPRPSQHLWLEWQWKATGTLDKANNLDRYADDAPLRILVAFDGDQSKLSMKDKMVGELAQIMSGQEMPYATLMYIWSNQLPVGTVVSSRRTDRIRKMVIESGPAGLNRWLDYDRDVRADFERAFGEAPGRLMAVGIMTDSDNTGGSVRAWYGPLSLRGAR